MSICNRCVTDKSLCEQCCDNPKYANIPRQSQFSAYIPTCPFGAEACILDPAYIKYSDPEWYQELYGDISPQEALQSEENYCLDYYAKHKDDKYAWCPHYDDEDK